ncbi:unnamed protein product [Closterium sp. NIES-53]
MSTDDPLPPLPRLPDDILRMIFARIGLHGDTFSHAVTCKRWLEIARPAQTAVCIRETREASSRQLANAIAQFRNLSRIHLPNCSVDRVDDDLLDRIAASCGATLTSFRFGTVRPSSMQSGGSNGGLRNRRHVDDTHHAPRERVAQGQGELQELLEAEEAGGEAGEETPAESTAEAALYSEITEAGLDKLFRTCPQLEEFGLHCAPNLSLRPMSFLELARISGGPLDTDSVYKWSIPNDASAPPSLQFPKLQAPSLTALPNSLGVLANLRDLQIGCSALRSLPETLGQLSRLTRLHVTDCGLAQLPDSLCNLFGSAIGSTNEERSHQLGYSMDWFHYVLVSVNLCLLVLVLAESLPSWVTSSDAGAELAAAGGASGRLRGEWSPLFPMQLRKSLLVAHSSDETGDTTVSPFNDPVLQSSAPATIHATATGVASSIFDGSVAPLRRRVCWTSSGDYFSTSPSGVVIHGSGCATCLRGQRCSFRVSVRAPARWAHVLEADKESWWKRDLALTLRGIALAHGDIRCLDPPHCTEFRDWPDTPCNGTSVPGRWVVKADGSLRWAFYRCAAPEIPPSEWIGALHERGIREISIVGDSHQRFLAAHLHFLLTAQADKDVKRWQDNLVFDARDSSNRTLRINFYWIDGIYKNGEFGCT